MGNQCETICCEGNDLKLGVLSSKNFDKLIHSKLVENQFPEKLIPQTVKEKLKLFRIQPVLAESQIWKYEDPEIKPDDSFNVAYAVISKTNLQKKPSNQSEQNIIANKYVPSSQNEQQNVAEKSQKMQKNVLKNQSFNPDRFQNATIYLFKSSLINSNDQSSQNPNHPQQTLTLKKVYHGPINPLMRAPDATIILENGDHYQGNVYEFNFQGKGAIRNALGNHTYEGAWQNNKPHGLGCQQLAEKFKYQGDFANGKWHGKGKLTLLNSSNRFLIDGTFLEGNIQGPGKVFHQNGLLIYDGLFKNGRQHGQGKWYGSNGQSYEGQFFQGRKQGFGKYSFKSGKQYEGNFKNDQPDGEGQLIEDDKKTKGFWYKGENILINLVVKK